MASILGAFLVALFLARCTNKLLLHPLRQDFGKGSLWFSLAEKISSYIFPLLTALSLEIMSILLANESIGNNLVSMAAKLGWAWLLVRLFTSFIVKSALSHLVTVIIFGAWALEIIGILNPLIAFLDSFGFQLDNYRFSLFHLFKAGIIAAFLLPLINFVCKFFETNLPTSSKLTPRAQILLLKILKLILYTGAIIISLDSMGLDFYLVSIFSGAMGIGLGFGLQRVVSNLFSGFIILMDNSIRPGDVIECDGLYGWIESLHGRFVSMVTRDGKSHLIPNEQLITNKLINWSFSSPNVRIKIPMGIAYGSDVRLAMKLMLEAAQSNPRVLTEPSPIVRLITFGDSAINLELRIWINDPQDGITDVTSAILLKIWDTFNDAGISFPFPQRDVHLRTPPEITVVVQDSLSLDEKASNLRSLRV
jgi:small-conductance mechanosensitive channel